MQNKGNGKYSSHSPSGRTVNSLKNINTLKLLDFLFRSELFSINVISIDYVQSHFRIRYTQPRDDSRVAT